MDRDQGESLRLLSEDGAEAIVRPDLGGGLMAWRVADRDLLRPAPRDCRDPFELASFPLVPFSNRIAGGRFRFGRRCVELPPNWLPHPHPLHGFGWRTAWRATDRGPAHVVLEHRGRGGPWPWPYVCRQRIAVEEGTLHLQLNVRNLADEPMPVGLGQHPYFPRPPGTVLRAHVESMWTTDQDGIPDGGRSRAGAAWLRAEGSLDGRVVDHVFDGWDGTARTVWPDGAAIDLRARSNGGAGFLTIYVPQGRDFFCVEPVTHVTDAVNRPEPAEITGFRVLAPGEVASLDVALSYRAP